MSEDEVPIWYAEVRRHPGLDSYHQQLRESVYPAIDQLVDSGEIEGAAVFNHEHLELRLRYRGGGPNRETVRQILEEHGLELRRLEQNSASAAFLERLELTSDLLRHVVTDSESRDANLGQQVHHLLNQYGFDNYHEAEWHGQIAEYWEQELADDQ